MEMDVNPSKISAIELVNISSSAATLNGNAGSGVEGGGMGFNQQLHNHQSLYHLPHHHLHHHHHAHHHHRLHNNNNNSNNNNNNGSVERSLRPFISQSNTTCSSNSPAASAPPPPPQPPPPISGCCGILGFLLKSTRNSSRTASSSIGDYNSFGGLNGGTTAFSGSYTGVGGGISSISGSSRKSHNRRTPQEVYFESRGKSCKKLLKFNGSSNKILLYPEEGWARTASSSYWTITPCWWQPNRCRIEEFMGSTQRQSAKAKMVPLEQKGSLLIAGNFGRSKSKNKKHEQQSKDLHDDEFKLYLSSNISMEDYNMGYCLTGFVERRCQQTNTFQMTHFAVIKRQWPSISNDVKST